MPLPPNAKAHALRLYDAGLIALPCWGGGKTMPGRDHRALADSPPTREQVGMADYSGGLSILCGTRHPAGGYVAGIDIDKGPVAFPSQRPHGFRLLEQGTSDGKWHLFICTTDRLEGVLNLYDRSHPFQDQKSGQTRWPLVAEVKGVGQALRSYPTVPPEKPRGYRLVALNEDPASNPPKLTARQVAEAMCDYLGRVLGVEVSLDLPKPRQASSIGRAASSWPGLAEAIEAKLQEMDARLKKSGRDGWMLGVCPFHDDSPKSPSFSVSFEEGRWHCFAGCGRGGLASLARKLGLQQARVRWHRGHPVISDPVPAKAGAKGSVQGEPGIDWSKMEGGTRDMTREPANKTRIQSLSGYTRSSSIVTRPLERKP